MMVTYRYIGKRSCQRHGAPLYQPTRVPADAIRFPFQSQQFLADTSTLGQVATRVDESGPAERVKESTNYDTSHTLPSNPDRSTRRSIILSSQFDEFLVNIFFADA